MFSIKLGFIKTKDTRLSMNPVILTIQIKKLRFGFVGYDAPNNKITYQLVWKWKE